MARARVAPTPESNSLVASAIRMPPVQANAIGKAQSWQGAAWDYYDRVGELRFVANWVGNVMSRATLVVAQDVDGTLVVQHDGPAVEAMDAFHGGMQGQQQMLQQCGIHLTVAGECYDTVRKDTDWAMLAYNKISANGKTITADFGDGKRIPLTGSGSMAIRIWTPHPRDPYRADAPTRSNLGTLGEIATLSEHVHAQLTSRLAGAGILFMPAEITFPTPKEADPTASQADQFMAVLGEAMMTPIGDRSNPSAIVPVVVTAPGDTIGDVKHLTFWTELDENVIPMREAAVKRLALGLDTPPEVLLGMADSNHWTAWLVDEAAIKAHLEPRLQVVCHAVTTAYMRPAIKGQVPDPDVFYVLADTSAIRLRPNRSREAIELWDRGELSGEAVRRETGFNPEDGPGQDENRLWLLRKIATGQTSPEQTQAALRLLGADLGPVVSGETQGARPSAAPIVSGPEFKPPSRDDADDTQARKEGRQPIRADRGKPHDGLAAACEVLVFRALERAGNKLCDAKQKANGLGGFTAHTRHLHATGNPDVLLEGTWQFASEVIGGYSSEPEMVVAVLDAYTRGLLARQEPYNRDSMLAVLATGGV